jgi:hypothetical protein
MVNGAPVPGDFQIICDAGPGNRAPRSTVESGEELERTCCKERMDVVSREGIVLLIN